MKTVFSLVLVALSNAVRGLSSGEASVSLENGCTITTTNSTIVNSPAIFLHQMPLPHLTCSGTNQTRLRVDGSDVQSVRSITITEPNLVELHIDDFKAFTSLETIEVDSNRLQRVIPSKQNLVFPTVTFASFRHNFLSTIPSLALKAFPNLKVLVLHNNIISKVYSDDFKFNSRLEGLYLGWNPIAVFEDDWMSATNLTTLNLRGCHLKKIPDGIKSLSKLQFLDLSENLIEDVVPNAFSGCHSLQKLQIASNKIKTIPRDSFNGARSLARLDFSDNLVEHLPEGTFDSINRGNLDINFYENPFNCNCSLAWFGSWVKNMKDADIATDIRFKCDQPARNHGKNSYQVTTDDFTCQYDDVTWRGGCNGIAPLTKIVPAKKLSRTCPSSCVCYDESGTQYFPESGDHRAMKDSSNRKFWIQQEYPKVKCLDAGLSKVPGLIPLDVKTLSFSVNKISFLKIKKLKSYNDLTILDFSGNQIQRIIADTSVQLPKVTAINLHNNNLTYLDKTFFWSFPQLRVVEFSYNKIKEIPNDLFMYNRYLQKLTAGPNPIESFQEDFLENLNLNTVVLRNMSLIEIPASLSALEEMRTCVLSDNFITTIKNLAFSKCTKLKKLILSNNRISVIEPNAFAGAASLWRIDLSENDLHTLSSKPFSNTSLDQLSVQLLENPFMCDCSMKEFKSWIEEVEAIDVTVEIRFRCMHPLRMHRKLSHTLSPSDFICKADDNHYLSSLDNSCPSQVGGILAAIIITCIVCILLSYFILRRCFFYNRHRKLFNQQSSTENIVKLQSME